MTRSARNAGSVLAASTLLLHTVTAWADGLPAAGDVRDVAEQVLARSEFVYGAPEGDSFLGRALQQFLGWMQRMKELHPMLFTLVFCAMVVALVILVAHIAWTIRMTSRRSAKEEDLDLEDAVSRADPHPFRARALAAAAEGRLADAVRHLYLAMLLALSRRGNIEYGRHKALLDYRLEAAVDPVASRLLNQFGPRYHPGSFGRRPPQRAEFDELVVALDEVLS